MHPSAEFVNRSIWYVPGFPAAYLNNPKAACSKMKKSLWLAGDRLNGTNSFSGRPHNRHKSPFCRSIEQLDRNIDDVVAATFYTVVRNPFVRVLSAYLDKVAKDRRDQAVWPSLAEKLAFDSSCRPRFGEFLSRMVAHDPREMDRHFMPQYMSILVDHVTPDFIGHVERIEAVDSFLAAHGMPSAGHDSHRTDAAARLGDFYRDDEVALVRAYYARDFELFGYSYDPEVVAPVRAQAVPSVARALLRELIMARANKTDGLETARR